MISQKCPICGAGFLERKVKTEVFNYKGRTKEIPNYIVYACAECGEAIVDNETLKESGRILKKFQHEVNGLLTTNQPPARKTR
jgi:YgiT-type zinc finger domain-containing protein